MRAPAATIFFLVLLISSTHAQNQTLTYSQEDGKMTSQEVQRFYRYITRADVQEKTLVKLGIWPASDRGEQSERRALRLGANAELALEQKISPAFSILAGFDGFWRYATYRRPRTMNPNTPLPQSYLPDKENSFQFNWKAGLRYYHAMPKKIKKGRSANNFSSNYLALQIAQPVRTYNRSTVYSPLLDLEQTRQWSDNLLDNPTPRLLIAYGFQRRLGTLAYADLYAGPEIQFSDYHLGPSFSFQLHALVGLGW